MLGLSSLLSLIVTENLWEGLESRWACAGGTKAFGVHAGVKYIYFSSYSVYDTLSSTNDTEFFLEKYLCHGVESIHVFFLFFA